MKRRDLVAGTLATLLRSEPASRIIDTHVHFYDPRRPEGVPWPPREDPLLYRPVLPREYAALVRPLGVNGTLVVEASNRVEDNQWVLDLARDHSIIVGVVGNLPPERFSQHLERFLRNPLFLGIRRNGAAIERELSNPENYRALAAADLTLDAIGQAGMLSALVTLTDRIPDLRVSINHMPAEPPGWQTSAAAAAAVRELAKRPRVFAKVSGVIRRTNGKVSDDPLRYKATLDEVWDLFGPDRVMYGSNWPVSDRLAPYATVLAVVRAWISGKGREATERYFWRNSQACYRWTKTGLVP